MNNEVSNDFQIKKGVKQGGILSPYLFNFFMNDLLDENDKQHLGAFIGCHNVSLISYCDDLIIISPLVCHGNKILKLCDDFASKWKLVFNINICH